MTCTIGAYRMVVVVPIDMIPVQVMGYAVVWMPPRRPVVPVEGRMPTYPRWSPEPVIDHWTVDIHGLNDIVCTIYIFITNHLHRHRF